MIDDDGQPILMDFGSTIKARINVETRQQALIQQVKGSPAPLHLLEYSLYTVQDLAAEQSSMPYRAPELFDVKTGTTLDEKVDIWVCPLGCCSVDTESNAASLLLVTGLHIIRIGLRSLAIRDKSDH
jgi:serine/threonine kinase 16